MSSNIYLVLQPKEIILTCYSFKPFNHLFSTYCVVIVQIAQLCLILCDPMDSSTTPVFPILRYLPEFAQTQVH